MRMIEQFVKALARILFNKKIGNNYEAMKEIEDSLSHILGLDYKLLNSLSTDEIINLVSLSKSSADVKLIFIAKFLKEAAEIRNEEKTSLILEYQKILTLLLEGIIISENIHVNVAEYFGGADEIIGKIKGYHIPADLRFRLFKYYELTGKFDKAEDELFHLKEGNYPDINVYGIKFYNNLERLNDTELQKGNLTKEEVKEGFEKFIKNF